jgi:uncharacterized protein (DUF4213/DUF364 family)
VGDLRVIDLEPADGEFPATAADVLVPSADVVGITGSTLINHTLDGVLSLCRPGAFVALVGPSAPFSPVVFDFGVSAVAGAQVLDEEAALGAVGQGASFRNVPGVRRAVLLRR